MLVLLSVDTFAIVVTLYVIPFNTKELCIVFEPTVLV